MLSHDMCAALGDEYGLLPMDMYRMARLPVHVLSGPGLPCCFSHIHGLPNVIQAWPGRRSTEYTVLAQATSGVFRVDHRASLSLQIYLRSRLVLERMVAEVVATGWRGFSNQTTDERCKSCISDPLTPQKWLEGVGSMLMAD